MKKTVLLTFFLYFIFTQVAHNQIYILEKRLKEADSLWKINKLNDAISDYKKIVAEIDIPQEYQSLVNLRLAEAQHKSGSDNDCLSTLSKLDSLSFVPAHHKVKATELINEIKGIHASDYTILSESKIIKKVFVSGKRLENYNEDIHCSTINEAFEAVKKILNRFDLPEGAIEIILNDDSYNLTEQADIGKYFSGTEKNPVIIRSFSPGEKTVISGGILLKSWKREKNPEILARLPENSRKYIIVADLKKNGISGIDSLVFGGFSSKRAGINVSSRFSSLPVPELFYKGKPQVMARWPNDKDTTVPLTDFKDDRILKWAAEMDLWLHGYWYYMWADAYEKVRSISVEDTIITLQPPLNNYGFGKSKWHVVNALSEIDIPGEWCLSLVEGKIWYYPPEGFNSTDCILSVNGPAFKAEKCNYLTIKDIDVRYVRGDGMVFLNCNNLAIFNCSVKNGSGYGIKIMGGEKHFINSCQIESMGRGGIDILSGNIKDLVNSWSIIENCTIGYLSRIDRTYTPAILLEGVGIKVRHCLFSEIPSSAIRLEGNDMLIELNEFSRCVIESDDQGAIDVFGNPLYRGNIIRWNFFHDIGIPNLHMAAGIRLDDAICGFSVYENLFSRASNNLFGGIQIHGGKDNYIEGNIFSDCHAAISQTSWGQKRWESTLTEKGHPVSEALKTYNWQSTLWMSRYPALKHLTTGGTDTNYATDNLVINGKAIFLRKSPKFQSLNNKIISGQEILNKPDDYSKWLSPWQKIPLHNIGPYKN